MDKNKNNSSGSYQQQEFKFSSLSNEKIYCILSYIYIFWLIGLLADKNNKTVLFHVNQGIILSTVSFFSLFIINILSNVLYSIAPILASLSAFLEVLWLLFVFVFVIIGIKNVLLNRQKSLPVIGNLFVVFK